MFDNERYMTAGINNKIPLDIQIFLWSCIDNLKNKGNELDYLQVFELKKIRIDDIEYQEIEHRSEQPEYHNTYKILPSQTVDAKIFVIDDGTYSTMMLSEEY